MAVPPDQINASYRHEPVVRGLAGTWEREKVWGRNVSKRRGECARRPRHAGFPAYSIPVALSKHRGPGSFLIDLRRESSVLTADSLFVHWRTFQLEEDPVEALIMERQIDPGVWLPGRVAADAMGFFAFRCISGAMSLTL